MARRLGLVLLFLTACGQLPFASQIPDKNYRDACQTKANNQSNCQQNLVCATPSTCGNPPISGCAGTCTKSCTQDADCGPCKCSLKLSNGALVCDVIHCSATDGG